MKEKLIVIGCVVLVLGYYAIGFNSWRFCHVGDEGAFYNLATELSQRLREIQWLNSFGVYGHHTIAFTGWQAVWIAAFGKWVSLNFAWRLSSAVFVAASMFPFYGFLKRFFPVEAVWAGCVSLFFAQMTTVWAISGINNGVGFFPLLLALWMYQKARADRTKLSYFLTGACAGLGIYLFLLAPLLTLAVVGFMHLLGLSGNAQEIHDLRWSPWFWLSRGLLIVIGFVVIASPILLQTDYFVRLAEGNLYGGEHLIRHQWRNTLTTLSVLVHFQARDHFLWDNVVDPLTKMLAWIGLLSGFWKREWKKGAFLWGYLLLTAYIAGGISQYDRPPVTRIHYMMIPIAIAVAQGITMLMRWKKMRKALLLAVSSLFIIGWNSGQLYFYNPYQPTVESFAPSLKRVQESPADWKHVFVVLADNIAYQGIMARLVYGYGYGEHVLLVLDKREEIVAKLPGWIRRKQPPVLITYLTDSPNIGQIETLCREHNGVRCEALPRWSRPQPMDALAKVLAK